MLPTREWLLFATLCACSSSTSAPTGTLAYIESGTGHVHARDLASSRDDVLDPGELGSVTIAPDGKHVSYQGTDQVTKIADRSGTVTPMTGRGCTGPATWLTSDLLAYCVSNGTMLLPSIGGTPRMIDNYGIAASEDGATVAYVDLGNNVIVESADGTNSRVLVPAAAGTTRQTLDVGWLTPASVLVFDSTTYPTALHVGALADGTSVDVPDAFGMGTPFGGPRFLGASQQWSADGSELLLQSTTELDAVSVATGAKRTIAAFADRQSAGGAAFLDDQHVLWVRVDDMSDGDIGMFALSLHLTGPTPTDDVVLDAPGAINTSWPTIAVAPDFIALPSDVLMIDRDGNVLASNPQGEAEDILGLVPGGVLTDSSSGEVRHVSTDGADELVITTASGFDQLLGPFAAFTPN